MFDIDRFFASYDAARLVLFMLVAMALGWVVGWVRARRVAPDRSEASEAGVPRSKFDDAALGLLALLIGFSFSMALGRHEHRREMVVADANAIGDFYQTVSATKEPMRSQLQHKIREYANLHARIASSPYDASAWEDALRRNQAAQSEMEGMVSTIINQGTPVAVPLMQTFNQLTSISTARIAAAEDLLPWSVVLMLALFAVVNAVLDGSEWGTREHIGRIQVLGTLSFVFLVALSIYVTLDLNQPQRGLITVSQAPMERLLLSLSK